VAHGGVLLQDSISFVFDILKGPALSAWLSSDALEQTTPPRRLARKMIKSGIQAGQMLIDRIGIVLRKRFEHMQAGLNRVILALCSRAIVLNKVHTSEM
jgi:hypothetical protein